MDALSLAPIEKLKGSWVHVVSHMQVLERLVVGGANTPDSAEVDRVLKEMAGLQVHSDMEALSHACSNSLQNKRWQVLQRVFSSCQLLGNAWPKFLDSNKLDSADACASCFDELSKLQHESASLHAWISGNKPTFGDMDRDWFASACETERAVALLDALAKTGKDLCLSSIAARVEAVKNMLPPKIMIEDPNLLTDRGLQATFMNLVTKNGVGDGCAELSAWCSMLRAAATKGVALPKQNELYGTRTHGKRCCGVHAVLVALEETALPKDATLLEPYVLALEAKLRKKGIGMADGMVSLPPRVLKVLDELRMAGKAAAGAAAAQTL